MSITCHWSQLRRIEWPMACRNLCIGRWPAVYSRQRLRKHWQCCVVTRAVGFCGWLPVWRQSVVAALAVSACSAWSRHQMVGWLCSTRFHRWLLQPPPSPVTFLVLLPPLRVDWNTFRGAGGKGGGVWRVRCPTWRDTPLTNVSAK